jgi:hypothetical protein
VVLDAALAQHFPHQLLEQLKRQVAAEDLVGQHLAGTRQAVFPHLSGFFAKRVAQPFALLRLDRLRADFDSNCCGEMMPRSYSSCRMRARMRSASTGYWLSAR